MTGVQEGRYPTRCGTKDAPTRLPQRCNSAVYSEPTQLPRGGVSAASHAPRGFPFSALMGDPSVQVMGSKSSDDAWDDRYCGYTRSGSSTSSEIFVATVQATINGQAFRKSLRIIT